MNHDPDNQMVTELLRLTERNVCELLCADRLPGEAKADETRRIHRKALDGGEGGEHGTEGGNA